MPDSLCAGRERPCSLAAGHVGPHADRPAPWLDPEVCADCGTSLDLHLTADECADHGIDPGLRDGLGCAVVTRVLR